MLGQVLSLSESLQESSESQWRGCVSEQDCPVSAEPWDLSVCSLHTQIGRENTFAGV